MRVILRRALKMATVRFMTSRGISSIKAPSLPMCIMALARCTMTNRKSFTTASFKMANLAGQVNYFCLAATCSMTVPSAVVCTMALASFLPLGALPSMKANSRRVYITEQVSFMMRRESSNTKAASRMAAIRERAQNFTQAA
ncbi:hypothetical protein D3C85_1313230 [compost metagenome]